QSIQVSCNPTVIEASVGTSVCTAIANDGNSAPVPGATFIWDVADGGATVDDGGIVTAGPTPGMSVIRAKGAGDSLTEGTALIDVQSPGLAVLNIDIAACPPASCRAVDGGLEYALAVGSSASFAATGVDQFSHPFAVSDASWTSSDTG